MDYAEKQASFMGLLDFANGLDKLELCVEGRYSILKNTIKNLAEYQEHSQINYINNVSDEILYNLISSYLPSSSIAILSMTCKHLYELCEDDRLWENKICAQILNWRLANIFLDYGEKSLVELSSHHYICVQHPGIWNAEDLNFNFVMDTVRQTYPLAGFKWWYSRFRKALFGDDETDYFPYLEKQELQHYAKNTVEIPGKIHSMISASDQEFYRQRYKKWYVGDDNSKSFKNSSCKLAAVSFREEGSLYKFFGLPGGLQIIFAACSQRVCIGTETESVPSSILIVNGTVIGPDFTWKGLALTVDREFDDIFHFGTGLMTWGDGGDSFSLDTSFLSCFPQSTCGHPITDTLDDEIRIKTTHPDVFSSGKCSSEIYPQWFSYNCKYNSDQLCTTCSDAGCTHFVAKHNKYRWYYTQSNFNLKCDCWNNSKIENTTQKCESGKKTKRKKTC